MTIDSAQAFWSFGRDLILTKDLDPLYVGVYGAQLSQPELATFLLTYFMFYNAGFSAQMVDVYNAESGGGYWKAMKLAVATKETRRGTERRHFRGKAAIDAVQFMSELYYFPTDALNYICLAGERVAFRTVMERAQKWPQFGPWIAFKVADMMDRCGYCSVDSDGCDLAMYDTPVKGARLYAELAGRPDAPVDYAIGELTRLYKGLTAPPAGDRPIGIYEVETVLCKVKSASTGHYYVGKDTIEIREMLAHEAESPTARRILAHMPETDQLELLYS